jgi:NADH:ubiquinone oxidoreductase subunit 6 (subunit J)
MMLQIFLLSGLVLFSVMAVLLRDLLKAAISLAAASILLAIVFFRMNAPYAGVFEISVVAGLITVLFITTVALTKSPSDVRENKLPLLIFPVFFAVFIVIDYLIMKNLLSSALPLLPGTSGPTGTFGQVFWNERTFDLVCQIGVIFAGVFSVLALFRTKDNHE